MRVEGLTLGVQAPGRQRLRKAAIYSCLFRPPVQIAVILYSVLASQEEGHVVNTPITM